MRSEDKPRTGVDKSDEEGVGIESLCSRRSSGASSALLMPIPIPPLSPLLSWSSSEEEPPPTASDPATEGNSTDSRRSIAGRGNGSNNNT